MADRNEPIGVEFYEIWKDLGSDVYAPGVVLVGPSGSLLGQTGDVTEVLADSSQSSTYTSSTITNDGNRGLIIYWRISATGSGNVRLTLFYVDEATNALHGVNRTTPIFHAGNVSAPQTAVYLFGPGLEEITPGFGSPTTEVASSMPLAVPKTWAVRVTHSGGTWSYALNYSYIS
jgi:hypothetical protein